MQKGIHTKEDIEIRINFKELAEMLGLNKMSVTTMVINVEGKLIIVGYNEIAKTEWDEDYRPKKPIS